ncbi:hypothetical protein FAIPA1_50093 [Frankia sp. AiPs1]
MITGWRAPDHGLACTVGARLAGSALRPLRLRLRRPVGSGPARRHGRACCRPGHPPVMTGTTGWGGIVTL